MRGIEFNKGWKFNLGEEDCSHLKDLDDTTWRDIHLPHDWSVEFPFDKNNGEACTGFLLGGIGWYRKYFITNKEMIDKKTIINFDGIYSRSNIYINGQLVTFHPYGYSPLLVDITSYLKPEGEENLLAVKVDHSRYADSRWYTGSGIYRKVSMHIIPFINIPIWGIKIQTDKIADNVATVNCKLNIKNETFKSSKIDLKAVIINHEGKEICKFSENVLLNSNTNKNIEFDLKVKNPMLWDTKSSNMYTLRTILSVNGIEIQTKDEKFGIRTIEFDSENGFYLNGENRLIKGVCLHHDAGLVGSAVPLDVWRRRLNILKDAGCNAIRTAHNPSSEDFLDLCDEMGFLVQEEFFDEWDNPKDKRRNNIENRVDYITRSYTDFFRDYAKDDLQSTLRRDINHPCIIQWSIGNEIEWTYIKYNKASGFTNEHEGGFVFWEKPPNSKEEINNNIHKIPREFYDIDKTAVNLSKWVKELDISRPVTANCILPSVSYETGYIDALDVVGFSYRRVYYERGHKDYPNKPIMGTENMAQWHEWKAVLDNKHIPGIFLWTGIDHMGEAWVQKDWPRKGSNLGLLDLAGFKKPAYHLFKCLWNSEPHIKIYTKELKESIYKVDGLGKLVDKIDNGWELRSWHWHEINEHWNYQQDVKLVVEVYSNLEQLELFLNNQSLGIKNLSTFEDKVYKWLVPYSAGEIKVVGKKDNKEIIETLITTGNIKSISLTSDKKTLDNNLDEVLHITAQFKDEKERDVIISDHLLQFEITGDIRNLGVDNGNVDNVQKFQDDKILTSSGRALMIIQARSKGKIYISANCEELGLHSNKLIIN